MHPPAVALVARPVMLELLLEKEIEVVSILHDRRRIAAIPEYREMWGDDGVELKAAAILDHAAGEFKKLFSGQQTERSQGIVEEFKADGDDNVTIRPLPCSDRLIKETGVNFRRIELRRSS